MSARRFFVSVPIFCLMLAGCSVHKPTQFYQLDAGAAEASIEDSGAEILLGPIQVADYLNREELVQRQSDGALALAVDGAWAGNLKSNINQQLLRQLAGSLNSSSIALFPEKPGFVPQVQVMMSISRLDSGPKTPAVIEARWRLVSPDGQLKGTRLFFAEELHQGTLNDQVRAQSVLLKRLSMQLGEDIQPIVQEALAEIEKPPVRRPAPKVAEEKPKPKTQPLVMPIRSDVEIYRF